MIRNGILLGLVFGIVGLIVFIRTLAGGVTPKAGQMIQVSFPPFAIRFAVGLLIGAAIPLFVVVAARYALIAHAMKQLSK